MATVAGAAGLVDPFANVYDWWLDEVGAFP
jgi:hypothetical protein